MAGNDDTAIKSAIVQQGWESTREIWGDHAGGQKFIEGSSSVPSPLPYFSPGGVSTNVQTGNIFLFECK